MCFLFFVNSLSNPTPTIFPTNSKTLELFIHRHRANILLILEIIHRTTVVIILDLSITPHPHPNPVIFFLRAHMRHLDTQSLLHVLWASFYESLQYFDDLLVMVGHEFLAEKTNLAGIYVVRSAEADENSKTGFSHKQFPTRNQRTHLERCTWGKLDASGIPTSGQCSRSFRTANRRSEHPGWDNESYTSDWDPCKQHEWGLLWTKRTWGTVHDVCVHLLVLIHKDVRDIGTRRLHDRLAGLADVWLISRGKPGH